MVLLSLLGAVAFSFLLLCGAALFLLLLWGGGAFLRLLGVVLLRLEISIKYFFNFTVSYSTTIVVM